MKNKQNRGFTLIELLVVIAVISLLSSIVFASLNSARGKARDARRLSDIHQMQIALESYYNDNNGYPHTTTTGTGGDVSFSDLPITAALTPKYIGQMPIDPTNVDPLLYRYYNFDTTFYVIRVYFEKRIQPSGQYGCFICGGPASTCAAGEGVWWGLNSCR